MSLLEQTIEAIKPADHEWGKKACDRLSRLTMPHWALGRIMDLAAVLAAMTRSLSPPLARRAIVVMAGDHGVAAEGVSLYPQEVTAQMVANFVRGGAGINALARVAGARVVVVDMGVAGDLSAWQDKVINKRVRPGTSNISREPAMSKEEARRSLEAGIEIGQSLKDEIDVFGTGDMGIANTTPSTAIAAVFTGLPPALLAGRGTGIGDAAWRRKVAVIENALRLHRPCPEDGLDVLAKIGGFEIGGLAGLMLAAAAQNKPVVVDGFISTAAALVAQSLCKRCADYMVLAHRSAEAGHLAMCRRLGKSPLLDLGMRLGEGTGAALAMPLIEAAARVLTEVATFEDAGVSRAKGG